MAYPSGAPSPGDGVKIAPVAPAPRPAAVPPREPAKRRRIGLWGLVLLVLVLAAGTALYVNYWRASKAAAGPVITVPTIAVSVGNVTATARVSGTVAAQNFASLLAPRITGSRTGMNRGGTDANFGGAVAGAGGGMGGDFTLILLHLAKAGIQVKAGDVVAEFDPQFQLQRYDDYKDTVVQLENNIKKLVANLAANKEAHDQSVRAAKAAWQQAVLDLQTAPIRSAIDAENYKLMAEQTDATYKQLDFESALIEESQRAAIRASALNQRQSEIELQRAQTNVQRMTIKSPMDGIVVMASIVRNGEFGQIREGDQVNPGQPFITIVDPRSMVLNATVNQVDAERLRLGMKANIRLDAYPGVELPGTLIGIGAMSKTSSFRASYVGEIPVRLKIEKSDSRLIPDLTGSAEIVLNTENGTIVAPREAVFAENDGSFVFVQGPEGWTRKKVELGLASFTMVSIRSGLQAGDVIALQKPI